MNSARLSGQPVVMQGSPSDAEAVLVSRTKPHAFVDVFDRHFDALHRYLSRRVPPVVAEELAAETFAQAFQHRGRYEPARASVRAWLFGIATNLLRHHYRAEERGSRAVARFGARSVAAAFELEHGNSRVADALAALTQAERDTLLLFAWAELGYTEIATALGVPVGTVRSRLHSARRKARDVLAGEGGLEDNGVAAVERSKVADG